MKRIEQKSYTRQRILDAAGRGFREGGFAGSGVDGMAKEAGVTSGAFYTHFASKAEAFRAAVSLGMEDLKEGIRQLQATHGTAWWPEFVRFYLGEKRQCALSESCGLQSLAPEVARSDEPSRADFESSLSEVAEIIVSGPVSVGAPKNIEMALMALATLAGAVTLCRAVNNPIIVNKIVEATERILSQKISD